MVKNFKKCYLPPAGGSISYFYTDHDGRKLKLTFIVTNISTFLVNISKGA